MKRNYALTFFHLFSKGIEIRNDSKEIFFLLSVTINLYYTSQAKKYIGHPAYVIFIYITFLDFPETCGDFA